MRVRKATRSDASLLADLAARTFAETFGAVNTAEDMALHLERSYGEEIQRRELEDARLTYLIAEVDGAPAGYALLRAADAPPCVAGATPIEIQRFYVDAPWHGVGVAAALMRACEREAERLEHRTLWLAVWERNARAQRFYEKMGFRAVGSQPFVLGTDTQTDRVMERSVTADRVRETA